MIRPALRVIQGGGERATGAASRASRLVDIAHELGRAASLALEAADVLDDADAAEWLDEATGRARAALAELEVLGGCDGFSGDDGGRRA